MTRHEQVERLFDDPRTWFTITTTAGDRTLLRFSTCRLCGATIQDRHMQKHAAWHWPEL